MIPKIYQQFLKTVRKIEFNLKIILLYQKSKAFCSAYPLTFNVLSPLKYLDFQQGTLH